MVRVRAPPGFGGGTVEGIRVREGETITIPRRGAARRITRRPSRAPTRISRGTIKSYSVDPRTGKATLVSTKTSTAVSGTIERYTVKARGRSVTATSRERALSLAAQMEGRQFVPAAPPTKVTKIRERVEARAPPTGVVREAPTTIKERITPEKPTLVERISERGFVTKKAAIKFREVAPGVSEQIEVREGREPRIIKPTGIGEFARAGGRVEVTKVRRPGPKIQITGFKTVPHTFREIKEEGVVVGVEKKPKTFVEVGEEIIRESQERARPTKPPGRFARTFLDPEAPVRIERRIRERERKLLKEKGKIPKFDVQLMAFGAQKAIERELRERPGVAALKVGAGVLLGAGGTIIAGTGPAALGAVEIIGAGATGVFIAGTGLRTAISRGPTERGEVLGRAGLDVILIGGGAALGAKAAAAVTAVSRPGSVKTHSTRQYATKTQRVSVEKGTLTTKKGKVLRFDARTTVSKKTGEGTFKVRLKDASGKLVSTQTGTVKQVTRITPRKTKLGQEIEDVYGLRAETVLRPRGTPFKVTERRVGELRMLGREKITKGQVERFTGFRRERFGEILGGIEQRPEFLPGGRVRFTEIETGLVGVKRGIAPERVAELHRLSTQIIQGTQAKGVGIREVRIPLKKVTPPRLVLKDVITKVFVGKKGQIAIPRGIPRGEAFIQEPFIPRVGVGVEPVARPAVTPAELIIGKPAVPTLGPRLGGVISVPTEPVISVAGVGFIPSLLIRERAAIREDVRITPITEGITLPRVGVEAMTGVTTLTPVDVITGAKPATGVGVGAIPSAVPVVGVGVGAIAIPAIVAITGVGVGVRPRPVPIPRVPLITPFVGFPFLPRRPFDFPGERRGIGQLPSPVFGISPGFKSIILGIRGPPPRGLFGMGRVFTGQELRPLPIIRRKRVRKRKKLKDIYEEILGG